MDIRRWEDADNLRTTLARSIDNHWRFYEATDSDLKTVTVDTVEDDERSTNVASATTSLTAYEKIPDTMLAVKQLGEAIAKSGFFACENVAQGEVIAMECLARRKPLLSLKEEFHISPKLGLVRKYDFMLRQFNAMGGKHRILERSDEAAEIGLEWQGQTIRERLTWDEAQKEKWPWAKEGKLKDNWATPRSRRQMLWARVVTEGLRALCPQATGGYYAPEEFDEIPDGETVGDVEDVPFTVEETKPAPVSKPTATAAAPAPTKTEVNVESTGITRDQVNRINDLYVSLDIPMEVREAALKRRGVGSLLGLTSSQAAEILSKLEAKAAERQVAAEEGAANLAGTSQSNPAATVAFDGSPCTPDQVNQLKQLIAEVEQLQPGVTKRIKDFLLSQKLNKLADLCVSDAERLVQHLRSKAMDGFFALDLAKAHARAAAAQTQEAPQGN